MSANGQDCQGGLGRWAPAEHVKTPVPLFSESLQQEQSFGIRGPGLEQTGALAGRGCDCLICPLSRPNPLSCPGCFTPGNVLVPFAGAIKVKHVEAEGFHLLFTFGPLKEIGCLREPGSLHLDLMPWSLPACS